MASNRINRTNDDIQLALSGILRSIKDPRVNQGLISITRVETTGDLRYAKVFVSVMSDHLDERELKKGLKSAAGYIRRELAAAVRLRYTPELIFEVDRSIEHGSRINELISRLETEGGDE